MKVKFVLFGVILFVVSLTCAVPSFAEPVERVERAVVNTTSGVHVSVRKTLSRKERRKLRKVLEDARGVVAMARAAADRAARIPDLEDRIKAMEEEYGKLATVRDELRAIEGSIEKMDQESSATHKAVTGWVAEKLDELKVHIANNYKKLYAQRIRVELVAALFLDAGLDVDLKQVSALGLNFLWHRDNWAIRAGVAVGMNTLEKNLGWSVLTSFERKWGRFSMGPVLLLTVDSGRLRKLKGTQSYVAGTGLSLRLTHGKVSGFVAPYLGVAGSKIKEYGEEESFSLGGGTVFGTAVYF